MITGTPQFNVSLLVLSNNYLDLYMQCVKSRGKLKFMRFYACSYISIPYKMCSIYVFLRNPLVMKKYKDGIFFSFCKHTVVTYFEKRNDEHTFHIICILLTMQTTLGRKLRSDKTLRMYAKKRLLHTSNLY